MNKNPNVKSGKVGKWESCGGNFDEAKVHGNSLTISRFSNLCIKHFLVDNGVWFEN